MIRVTIVCFTILMLSQFTYAASFDCAKASTKVETMICADPSLSKLDEDLAIAYRKALKRGSDTAGIKQRQRNWLSNVRNQCQDENCLKSAYQNCIRVTNSITKETYTLVMSKNDDVCNYMRDLMEADLNQFSRTYDSNDRFVSTNDVFNAVPWKPARASLGYDGNKPPYTEAGQLEGALFDLNNDGVEDYVIRNKGMLSGMRVDALYMFDRRIALKANDLTTKELFESDNQLSMDQVRYALAPESGRETESFWLLSPFIYKGTSYIYMQSLYEMIGQTAVGDFVAISKYSGGKFEWKSTGKMEDICYIKREGE